ncbi:O-antigen ligase family protein [Devosia submarina]|uniref:O-antigen ligase family protein n=1 Tax=Devosia submarina TaxID=1173082 RepID=UPI000D3A567F|nr:O-antigen ligase family protein [Devosia submarina]
MSSEVSGIVVHARRSSGDRVKGQNLRSRANGFALWASLIAIVLSPVPLGSARPLAWAVWGVYFGLTLTVYALLMQRSRQPFRVTVADFKVPAVLFGALLVWLVIQVLPLGGVFGGLPVEGRLGIVAFSDTLSVDPGSTILMLVRQCTYAALFFLVLQIAAHPARRERALNIILFACLGYALLGIVALNTGDWILGLSKWAYEGSATGTFVNRNSYATFLAFGSVIAASKLARHVADRLERHYDDGPIQHSTSSILLYSLAFVFLLAVIVATQSRMGFAAALAGSLIAIVGTAARSSRALPIIIGATLLGVLATILALSLFGQALFDRFGTVERSALVRTDLYQQVLALISLRPLTGYGGGSFELAYPLVHELPVNLDLLWDKAHNTYLTLWSELGLIGGSLPLVIIALLVWRTAMAPRGSTSDWRFRCMLFGVVTVAAVHSLADFSLEIQANAIMFVALLALGMPAADRAKS